MKTKTVLSLAIVAGFLLSSCEEFINHVTPSPTVTREFRDVSGYSGIDVSHAFNVYVNFSESEESIEVEANENLHDYIIVETVGNNLNIRLKDMINIGWGSATLNVYITTSESLYEFKASGASTIIIEDSLVEDDVFVELSGASTFSADIEADQMVNDISGASGINLSGQVNYLRLDASGASTLKDYDLHVDWLDVELSGASDAYITVNERLDVEASGASSVYYRGEGMINSQNLSGASDIIRMD